MQNNRADTVVHSGLVVSSAAAYEASIAIIGGQITAPGPLETMPRADSYIDATGKYVLPGAIDCHVHLGGCGRLVQRPRGGGLRRPDRHHPLRLL